MPSPSTTNAGPFMPNEVSKDDVKKLVHKDKMPIVLSVNGGSSFAVIVDPNTKVFCGNCYDPGKFDYDKKRGMAIKSGFDQHLRGKAGGRTVIPCPCPYAHDAHVSLCMVYGILYLLILRANHVFSCMCILLYKLHDNNKPLDATDDDAAKISTAKNKTSTSEEKTPAPKKRVYAAKKKASRKKVPAEKAPASKKGATTTKKSTCNNPRSTRTRSGIKRLNM